MAKRPQPPPVNMVLPGSMIHTIQYVEHPAFPGGFNHMNMLPRPPMIMPSMVMAPPRMPFSAANMMFPPMYPPPCRMPPPTPLASSLSATSPPSNSMGTPQQQCAPEERTSSPNTSFFEKVCSRIEETNPEAKARPQEQADVFSKKWVRSQWKEYISRWTADDAKTRHRLKQLKSVQEDVADFVVWMSANYREALMADLIPPVADTETSVETNGDYYSDVYPIEEMQELNLSDCNFRNGQMSSPCSLNILAKPWSPRAAKLQSQVANALYGTSEKASSVESADPDSSVIESANENGSAQPQTMPSQSSPLKAADSLPDLPDPDFGDDDPVEEPIFCTQPAAAFQVVEEKETVQSICTTQSVSTTDMSATDDSEVLVQQARNRLAEIKRKQQADFCSPNDTDFEPPLRNSGAQYSAPTHVNNDVVEDPKPTEAKEEQKTERRNSFVVDEDYAWLNDYNPQTAPSNAEKPEASPVEVDDDERELHNFSNTSIDAVTDNGNNRSTNENISALLNASLRDNDVPEVVNAVESDDVKENVNITNTVNAKEDQEDDEEAQRYESILAAWKNPIRKEVSPPLQPPNSVEAAHELAGNMEIYPVGHDGLIIEDMSDERCIAAMQLENLLSDAELAECQPEEAAKPAVLARPPIAIPPVRPPRVDTPPEEEAPLGTFAMDANSSTDVRIAALRVISRHGRIVVPELLRQMSIEKTKRLIAESSDDSPPPSGSQTPSVPLPCLERVRAASAGKVPCRAVPMETNSTEPSPSHSAEPYSPSDVLSPLKLIGNDELNSYDDDDLVAGSENSVDVNSPSPQPLYNIPHIIVKPSAFNNSDVFDVDLTGMLPAGEEGDSPYEADTPPELSPVRYTQFSDQMDSDDEHFHENRDWDIEVGSPIVRCELDPTDCTEHSHMAIGEANDETLTQDTPSDDLRDVEQNSESGDVTTDNDMPAPIGGGLLLMVQKTDAANPPPSTPSPNTDNSPMESSELNSESETQKSESNCEPVANSEESGEPISSAVDSESAPPSSISVLDSDFNVMSSISVTPSTERSRNKSSPCWRDGLDEETVAACDEFFSQI